MCFEVHILQGDKELFFYPLDVYELADKLYGQFQQGLQIEEIESIKEL